MNFYYLLRGLILLVLIFTAILNTNAQKPFIIQGQIGPDQQGMISIKYIYDQKDVVDSCRVENGKFTLKGNITEPVFAQMVYIPSDKSINGQYRALYLDPGQISISGNAKILDAEMKGGPSLSDFLALTELQKPGREKSVSLEQQMTKAKEENDDEKMKVLREEYAALIKERAAIQTAFYKSHLNSFVGFEAWRRKLIVLENPEVVEPEFNLFSPELRNSLEGKKIAARIAIGKKLLPGNPAPDFTLNDSSGKPVSLSSLKGKNVVLFFWAKNYFPFEPIVFAINKISRQLKDENLVVLTVYFDMDNDYEWKSVLEEVSFNAENIINVKDSMPLVGETNPDKSAVMKAYGMSTEAGMHAYLISPDGKIVIRNIDLMNDPVKDIKSKLTK